MCPIASDYVSWFCFTAIDSHEDRETNLALASKGHTSHAMGNPWLGCCLLDAAHEQTLPIPTTTAPLGIAIQAMPSATMTHSLNHVSDSSKIRVNGTAPHAFLVSFVSSTKLCRGKLGRCISARCRHCAGSSCQPFNRNISRWRVARRSYCPNIDGKTRRWKQFLVFIFLFGPCTHVAWTRLHRRTGNSSWASLPTTTMQHPPHESRLKIRHTDEIVMRALGMAKSSPNSRRQPHKISTLTNSPSKHLIQ
ncbi:uncharacterized protein LY79DRAFT_406785 [Colletotrichum navitas]|uniref:Uncharacterized protein n=1 Tax=Colletotrichum navitas TaxID=681940 RepID=A0AAD8Q7E0_9PEZI|nr:uncharacterized protein LY79DRAFT_406785 [Colletotrichum navitas]KAK1597172.1 hypothetical protein LY79DRAFT_406785 [Colletotrichum navitas]